MTNRALALLAAGVAIASAVLGSTVGGSGAAVLLVLLQIAGLGVWFRAGWRIRRGWATANFVTGAAWLALFLGPCAVYAVAPRHLPGLDAAGAIGVVDVSLFALLAGYVLTMRSAPVVAERRRIEVRPTRERPARAVAWFVVGLAGLAVLLAHAGGPAAYLSHLGETAGLNSGLFYVVWIALALRFAPFALVFVRWLRGVPVGPAVTALVLAGLALVMLTGARSFVAVGAVQLVLASALLRGRPSLARLAPIALVAGVALVFGLGTIKRHQSYNAQHPGAQLSLWTYATDVAPSSLVDAYVNNYVDTVRLVAVARSIVPKLAPYEGPRPLVELALKPVPSSIRPNVHRNREIAKVFDPHGGFAYAEPLQATAYLAGGPFVVALAFALVGLVVGRLDRWLATPALRSPVATAAAISLCVQIPVMLRSGVPNGVAFLGIEVLGTAAVTWSVCGGSLLTRRRRPAPSSPSRR
ncbi:MAG: hypothetical protein JWN32_4539 [Solirubrobacterales bacterium]|nr:hypothetical protein [Solirubrobacterales bacterium]